MKKMMNYLIVLMLMGSMLPLAFADDESGNISNNVVIDAETQQQVEIMNNGLGAEIRLLQLEKAIIKNINIGEEIISLINESDVNTTELQVILEELELLILPEVQAADPNASDALSIFVDLKHDAVNISTDFRDTVRGLLTDSMLEQIKQQTRNMTCNKAQNLSQTIENKIRQYNSNQFRNIYQILGENANGEILGYQNGSMTQKQVRQNITTRLNEKERENRFSLLASLKQQKIRYKLQAQNRVQNTSEGFKQRQENRLQKRLQRIEDLPYNPLYQQLMKRVQNKLNNMGNNGGNGDGPNNGEYNEDNGSGQEKPGYGNNDGSNSPRSGGGN